MYRTVGYFIVMAAAPRRAPRPEDRRRDPERTRRALLDAALTEFAARGYDGTRVSDIAARAGVSKQLVSYYFGGKEGLYQAIVERWSEREAEIAQPGLGLEELVLRYLEGSHQEPEMVRVFLRDNLDLDPATIEYDPDDPDVAGMRERQRAGEITGQLDPAFILLTMQAIVMCGAHLPGDVKRYLGMDPNSPEFLAFMRSQLPILIRRLGPGDDSQSY